MFNAYVLHATCYRETSLIVKFFTKEHGIINLVANGAKRKKSQFAGILQPFVPLVVYWKNHSIDLATLHKAEAVARPYQLSGTYLFGSLYINELLIRLLAPNDPHVELFDFYQDFLNNLNNLRSINKIFLEKNLRFIEKKILKSIGYELELQVAAIDAHAQYYFDFEDGLMLHKIELPHISQIIISGKSLLALYNDNFTDAIDMQEAKLFMRKILAQILGHKPLETRKLFNISSY